MQSPAFEDWVARARAVHIEAEIERRGIKLNGGIVERCGPCPRCGGNDRFSINTQKQVFNCRHCKTGGDVIDLVQFLDGTEFLEAVETLAGEPPPKCNGKHGDKYNGGGKPWTFLAEDIYQAADSAPYLRVQKKHDGNRKQYPQSHWTGTGWASGAPAGPKIPFRLPALLAAPITTTIYIVEGESCVNALTNLGFVATTNSGGAAAGKDSGKKWTKDLNAYFKGRNVVIVADNDEPGRQHVQYVAKQLHAVAESIRVLDLSEHWPGGDMPEHYDVADFLVEHDPSGSRLAKLAKEAPLWDPSADKDKDKDKDKAKAKEGETEDEVKPDGDSDADDDADNKAVKRKQADILVELAETATLFHTAAGDGFADVDVSGHRETHKIRSRAFKSWLAHQYYLTTKGAPNSDAMQSALNVLEARALFEGVAREVHLRVAEHGGRVYIDLADPAWRAIEVGADGWRTVAAPPVRFRRTQGMLPLPEPERGGSIDALRSLLNVKDKADFVLVVAWLLASLRGRGPFPVLVVSGEQGTAKTSFCNILRALVDPFSVPERGPPRSDHDLHIAANGSYVPAFDNLSNLSPWVSDTLCRLSTGGGLSVRRLFSDDEEVLFRATRPILLNGIEEHLVTRPDLADRSILLTLEPIPDDQRREKADVEAELGRELPRLLGVLLDGVAHGLRKLPDIKLTTLPRMADFARWGAACEGAFGWPAGTFATAYAESHESATDTTLEADGVASSVRSLMSDRDTWTGTASDLLNMLGLLVTESQRRGKGWPALPHHLSGRLRRAAPALRKVGIEVEFQREGKGRTRVVRLTTQARPEGGCNSASAASAASSDNEISDLPRTGPGGAASASASAGSPQGSADAQVDAQVDAADHPNPLANQQEDAADAADAHLRTLLGDAEDDDLFPTFLRRCNHCGNLGTAGEPLNPYDWPGVPAGVVLLHARCEEPWHDRESERGAV